mmetsp:Transcript_7187/g.6283  ORF Transcript_7187/g.6283 Transcript_7187/m.6283 type:complete len:92 (-) Transcript_7187:1001-1276(-)
MRPEILTYLNEAGKFAPIAIGFYFPDGRFRVYTAGNFRYMEEETHLKTWTFAKMHAMSSDYNYHESVKHLGMGHLYCEPMAIAHHNVYTMS